MRGSRSVPQKAPGHDFLVCSKSSSPANQSIKHHLSIDSQCTSVLRIRIRGLFDPWIRDRFFSGSRIPNPYFWELSDNFFGKKFYNSWKIGPNFFFHHFIKKIISNFVKFVATKKGMTKKFFSFLSFVPVFGSGIRDPGWVKIRIRVKHPGSATLQCIITLPGWKPDACCLSSGSPWAKLQSIPNLQFPVAKIKPVSTNVQRAHRI